MVNFQPNKIFPWLADRALRNPVYLVVLPAGVIYVWHLAHWGWLRAVLLVLPVLGLNLLGGQVFYRICRRRLAGPLSLGPELMFILAAAGGLLLLPEAVFGTSLATGIVLALLGWLLVQFLLKQAGGFYTAYIGLFIFLAVFYSFHLLHAEERLVLEYLARARNSEIARAVRDRYTWEIPGGRRLLKKDGRPALAFAVPQDLFFHDPFDLQLDFRYGLAGMPIGVFSASATDPQIAPVLVLFALEPGDPDARETVVPVIRRLLGHMSNAALLADLKFIGARQAAPPLTGGPSLDGAFWSYTEAATTRTMQTGYYAFGTGDGRFVFFLREPVFTGFRHHPDLLYIIRSLQFPEEKAAAGVTTDPGARER